MPSINFTAGNHMVSTNAPSPTGDWTMGGWYKFGTANYTSGFPTLLSWDEALHQFIYIQTEGGSGDTTKMAAGVFNDPNLNEQYPLTGSNTNWVFIAFRHVSGAGTYTLSYRTEGQASLTNATINPSGQAGSVTVVHLGTDGVGEDTVDGYIRSFFLRADVLSDAALLTASTSLSAPAGTNHTFLPLNSLTGTGTNLGTGGNYTITGTLSLSASEPNPSIGTTYDVPLDETAIALTDSSTLSRDLSVIGYRFVRFRD